MQTQDLKIKCEKIESQEFAWTHGPETFHTSKTFSKTCKMSSDTAINVTNSVIASSKDNEVEGFTFGIVENRKVQFLPAKVYDKFPNLMGYSESQCSLKILQKEWFAKLRKLVFLYLWGNQIEKIKHDTFKDLVALEHLSLGKYLALVLKYKRFNLFCFYFQREIK